MSEYTIALTDEPSEEELEIFSILREYNESKTGRSGYRPLTLLLRDEHGQVAGGLHGSTSYGWLFIGTFVLKESARGRRCGSRMLVEAEAEALRRGCHHAYLDTFDFQARPFYEKHGYTVFGVLEDHPPGHSHYWMKKDLAQQEGDRAAFTRGARG